MPDHTVYLTREDILKGLERVNARLEEKGVRGEICLYGGACMCLAFAARNSTKDVDAVFEPAAMVRQAASDVAVEMGWPWTWLNDDVKGFLSIHGEGGLEAVETCEFSHLKVYAAKADYLLAMKCLAARLAGDGDEDRVPDLDDAVWLCGRLGISDREGISQVVLRYFPDREIPERTDFFVEEVLSTLRSR